MARLSVDQWDRLKADWCTGRYTYQQLSDMHGVSDAAIIKRKKIEGWEVLPESIVAEYVDVGVKAKLAIDEVSKVSKVSATNLEQSLMTIVDNKVEAEKVGMTLLQKIQAQAEVVEDAYELKELTTGFKQVYEPMFKSSQTAAMQVNLNQAAPQVRVIYDQPE